MPYATARDLLARSDAEEIARLADRGSPRIVTAELLTIAALGGDHTPWGDEETAAVNACMDVIALALSDAQSTINGYLAGRYQVPLAAVPEIIKRLTVDLARYFLAADNATESVEKRHKAAVDMLSAISKGTVSLGVNESAQPSKSNGGAVMTSAPSVWRRGDPGAGAF